MYLVRTFAFLCTVVFGLMTLIVVNSDEATNSAVAGGFILLVPSVLFWLWMRHVTCGSCKGRRSFSVYVSRHTYTYRTCAACGGSGRPARYRT